MYLGFGGDPLMLSIAADDKFVVDQQSTHAEKCLTYGTLLADILTHVGPTPIDARYILQTANSSLPHAQALDELVDGLLKNVGGVLQRAIPDVDYALPGGTGNPPTGPAGGDLTGTYPNPDLATIGSALGPIGDGTHVARITIDAKGRVTAISSVLIAGAPPTGAAGGDLTGTYPNPTLAAIGAATGPIGDLNHVPRTTIDTKGRVTALTSVKIEGVSGEYVENMTDLRAYSPGKQITVTLGGFYTKGDGGGGLFAFVYPDSSSVDDGGTRIVPGGSAPVVNASGVITTPGTTATVGCWFRVEATDPFTAGESKKDVRWFGALPDNSTDNTPFFRLALASILYDSGCVYIPSGQWAMATKWLVDGNLHAGSPSVKGDGPGATVIKYAMTTSADAMIELRNGAYASFQDISIRFAGFNSIFSNPCILKIKDTTSLSLLNVKLSGLISTSATSGVIHCDNNTNLTMLGCESVGGFGQQLYWQQGSGLISTCNFTEGNRGPGSAWSSGTAYGVNQYVTYNDVIYMSRTVHAASATPPPSAPADWEVAELNRPAVHINSCNTLKLSNNFISGGGPWCRFMGSTITRTGANFTITTPTNHTMIAGDYCVVTGASQAAFNGRWKIASVGANTITITLANALASDTCTVTSLWSSMYIHGLTESEMDFCFFNTGGGPGVGSVGVFMDAFSAGTNNIGGFSISNCICDYGATAFFIHGLTNNVPGSSASGIYMTNCRPNGGPRDEFGCHRIEGAVEITMDGCTAFPGDNNPPGTGATFNSVVISDGGQPYQTHDICITGGQYTTKLSTVLYPAATIRAFVFDGANVHNVTVVNPSVDAAITVAQFVNGAVTTNGITVMYSNEAGKMVMIDSDGTNVLNPNLVNGTFNANIATMIISILQAAIIKMVPETNYVTIGAVTVNTSNNNRAVIGLTGNFTLSLTGMANDQIFWLQLINTTGGVVTVTYPAWTLSVGTILPATLNPGEAISLNLNVTGTTVASVVVTA